MPIEVRQLTIKSNVQPHKEVGSTPLVSFEYLEEFKETLLEECRRMVEDVLRDERAR